MSSLKTPVSTNDHIQGSDDALVTLVEYGDYQCPYCGEAYAIVKQLQQKYPDTLRLVFRNFPLSEAHPHALSAAMTAEFAGTKGLFWEAHDALYEHQSRLGLPLYKTIMDNLELANDELLDALHQGTFGERIRADFKGGVRSGVNGTPCFFFDGQRYDGPADLEAMSEIMDQLIAAHRRDA